MVDIENCISLPWVFKRITQKEAQLCDMNKRPDCIGGLKPLCIEILMLVLGNIDSSSV